MHIFHAAVSYFAITFGCGFVLGTARTLLLVPRIGARRAELAEAPLMLTVTIAAARWSTMRLTVPPLAAPRLAMGGIALALLLAMEFGPMLWLRRMSIRRYWAERDPVAASVYYALLTVFALTPWFLGRF